MKKILLATTLGLALSQASQAALLTDANDARSWQGATVGTFAQLYFGANTAANRQLVIDNNLLDDGYFNTAGYTAATLISNVNGGGCLGTSYDSTGAGGYAYGCNGSSVAANANSIDNTWFQTDGVVGQTVFDFGFNASTAVVFNTIDHGSLPDESIESTVYLSKDKITWVQAVTQRVWLEGFQSNVGIQWDGFTYAVGTGTNDTFRYASVIHGGPGALEDDGDNELNGIMGAAPDFTHVDVPEPSMFALMMLGLLGLWGVRKTRAA
jgi:hypothetical protein